MIEIQPPDGQMVLRPWYRQRRNRIFAILFFLCLLIQLAIWLVRSAPAPLPATSEPVPISGRILVCLQLGIGHFDPDNNRLTANGRAICVDPKTGTSELFVEEYFRRARVSPNGRVAAFQTADNAVVTIEMATKRRTTVAQDAVFACWSNDSNAVLVKKSTTDGASYEIVRISDQRRTPLTLNATVVVHDWSPDGNWLLTTSQNEGGLRTIDPTDPKNVRTFTPMNERCASPRYSPNGKKIAYVAFAKQRLDVCCLFLDGNPVVKAVKTNVKPDTTIAWISDSEHLLIGEAKSLSIQRIGDKDSHNVFTADESARVSASDWVRNSNMK